MTAAADITAWRPEPLTAARRRVAGTCAALDAALVDLGTLPTAAWTGVAADAAMRRHGVLVDQLRALVDAARALDHALAAAADRVAGLGAYDIPLGVDRPAAHDIAADMGDIDPIRLARAVQVADQIDSDLVAALDRAAHDVGAIAEAAAQSAQSRLAPPPPVGLTTPPSGAAIDHENRIRLDRTESELVAQVAALEPGPPTWRDLLAGTAGAATIGTLGGGTRRIAYEQAVAKLAAVRATREVLNQPDGRTRQLLAFDASGRSARVAVAVGDVDRAQHVAVVVPGFTTTVERDLLGSDRLAADLADESGRAATLIGDHRDVAVISWLGYDIPQTADTFRGNHSVVLRRSAEDGADGLNLFLRALPAGRHLTLIGHSYGSTTAGIAVSRGKSPVDDLVVLGSPGLGVGRTADLGLPAGRVHVLEAVDDPVADLGWFGPDPDTIPAVDRLSTRAARLPDESEGTMATGHSQYLSRGTTSQWNVAAVVVGAPLVRADRPPSSW